MCRRPFLSNFISCFNESVKSVISVFCRGVNEIFAFWARYGARLVIWYRRCGTTYRSHLQGSSSLGFWPRCWPRCYLRQWINKQFNTHTWRNRSLCCPKRFRYAVDRKLVGPTADPDAVEEEREFCVSTGNRIPTFMLSSPIARCPAHKLSHWYSFPSTCWVSRQMSYERFQWNVFLFYLSSLFSCSFITPVFSAFLLSW